MNQAVNEWRSDPSEKIRNNQNKTERNRKNQEKSEKIRIKQKKTGISVLIFCSGRNHQKNQNWLEKQSE